MPGDFAFTSSGMCNTSSHTAAELLPFAWLPMQRGGVQLQYDVMCTRGSITCRKFSGRHGASVQYHTTMTACNE